MSKEGVSEAKLKALYAELNKFCQNEDFDKALKTTNKIIELDGNDDTAKSCKLVCLIQVSKFTEAIQFIDRMKLQGVLFEKAYCKYRLNLPAEALKIIEDSGLNPLPDKLKELKAQILYRLEKFEDSFDLYREIIKNTNDDYEDERAANLSAVAANLAAEGSTKELSNLRDDTYELNYNSACVLAGQHKYHDAEKKLRQSEKLCREFMEEDGAAEDDIVDELAIIRVQLGYCQQMQGKIKDASVIYAEALKNKPKDVALTAVASNNIVVINKSQNVFDSKKKMRSALADACEHKLNSSQKRLIAINNCLLTYFANQGDQCHALCNKLSQQNSDLELTATLIKVNQYIKDKKYKDAVELLEKSAKTSTTNALEYRFALVQVHLLNGNKLGAIETLQSLDSGSKYRPGVVSALVSLMLGSDDKQGASQVLKDAVDWYKKSNAGGGDLTDMWRQAADFHLRGGQAETAASSLEELLKRNPSDVKILAQLVIAYAQFDPNKAQASSKRLPMLDTMTNAAEINSLETTNWMMGTKAVKKTAAKSDQSPGASGENTPRIQKRRQKKRKPKLPLHCNVDVAPDPERWLPKYERTGYRKKRDRRTKEIIKGSQGMASGAADQYDMSKTYNLSKNSPATPSAPEPQVGPRQHQRKFQKKKKGRH